MKVESVSIGKMKVDTEKTGQGRRILREKRKWITVTYVRCTGSSLRRRKYFGTLRDGERGKLMENIVSNKEGDGSV